MQAKRIFLKGIDYFQLLIDHHSKKKGGRGHEARLAVFLNGIADEKKIREAILGNTICNQLAHARISKSWGLGYPSLYFTSNPSAIPVTTLNVDGNEIPESCLNTSVDVYSNPPLHLQVIYFNNRTSCLLFTFHHILFDFAGVQAFVNSLTGKDVALLPAPTKGRSFNVRFNAFFRAVFFTFREANRKMTVPEKPLPVKKPSDIVFSEVAFSSEETKMINKNCKRFGLETNQSVFFLAATSKTLHDKIFSKQVNHNFIWVPVPVNFRKKGNNDAVLFNGLSFLFYKLLPDELADIAAVISSIRHQMKTQMKNEMPAAFIDFADGYYYMPMPFYYPMMKLPSLGKLSSFSFSVLGNTFVDLKEFMGLPVIDVKNYPSNSTAPGITFLFYEFRGELRIMSSWVKGQYSEEEQRDVIQHLRELLLMPVAST